jgi:tRNA A-37 threonylcarbamoyl transferase component Bud32
VDKTLFHTYKQTFFDLGRHRSDKVRLYWLTVLEDLVDLMADDDRAVAKATLDWMLESENDVEIVERLLGRLAYYFRVFYLPEEAVLIKQKSSLTARSRSQQPQLSQKSHRSETYEQAIEQPAKNSHFVQLCLALVSRLSKLKSQSLNLTFITAIDEICIGQWSKTYATDVFNLIIRLLTISPSVKIRKTACNIYSRVMESLPIPKQRKGAVKLLVNSMQNERNIQSKSSILIFYLETLNQYSGKRTRKPLKQPLLQLLHDTPSIAQIFPLPRCKEPSYGPIMNGHNLLTLKSTDSWTHTPFVDPFKEAAFRKRIGKGTTGNAFLVYDFKLDKVCTAKVFNKENILKIKRAGTVFNEINILQMLPKHENVCQFYRLFETRKKIYVILEFCGNEDLYAKIRGLQEPVIKSYAKQLLSGHRALHKAGICHMDSAPVNIVANDQGQVKLIDFGNSITNNVRTKRLPNILSTFRSYEMCIGKEYTPEKFDIWVDGVLIFYMFVYKMPWGDAEDAEYFTTLSKLDLKFPLRNHRPPLSELAKDLISKILVEEEKRPSIDEILAHPWFS